MTWVLWNATILITVLLILFREDASSTIRVSDNNNSIGTFAENSTVQEHLPENAHEDFTVTEGVHPDAESGTIEEPYEAETEHGSGENTAEDVVETQNDTEVTEEMQEESDTKEDLLEPGEDEAEESERPEKRELDPDKPMIALTFDDGPYRENTTSLLDLLEQYDARATFFVVGYHLDVYYEATIDAYRRGFQIGNHTASHPSLRNLSIEEALEEIRSLNERLNDLGIPGDVMLRPPYGEFSAALKEKVSVPMIGWNVDSQDWLSKDADKIYEQLVGKVKDGDIVLLHDLQDATIEAMQRVVPEMVAQGFQLVTLEELFEAKGVEPEAGTYYCYVR